MSETAKRRVQSQYDSVAAGYERRWSRYVEASVAGTVARLQIRPGDRVLDIGCGTGLLLGRLLERQPLAQYAGVDLSVGMLSEARRRLPPRVRLVAGDAEAIPFPAGVFDVVVSSSSFHYWPSPRSGLVEVHRVLRPNGVLVITDWCDDYLACKLCDRVLRVLDPAHHRIYGRAECTSLLEGAAYTQTSVERYRISWLWGLMTAIARVPASSG